MIRTTLVIALSLTLLSACGLKGDLERPVPLWGNPPNEGPLDPRTLKAEEEKKLAEEQAGRDRRAAAEAARQAATPAPAPAPAPTTPPR
ncbi:MAG: lipoprotein [Alphaproteobacteria bacterium]|nr:lipoprotein [Alphaproteobacteria bacterium]